MISLSISISLARPSAAAGAAGPRRCRCRRRRRGVRGRPSVHRRLVRGTSARARARRAATSSTQVPWLCAHPPRAAPRRAAPTASAEATRMR
eukprot:scaffold731_cov328-Prasinococcus_capsulatus_cf.AAC.9